MTECHIPQDSNIHVFSLVSIHNEDLPIFSVHGKAASRTVSNTNECVEM
jgi:hypothetical protein